MKPSRFTLVMCTARSSGIRLNCSESDRRSDDRGNCPILDGDIDFGPGDDAVAVRDECIIGAEIEVDIVGGASLVAAFFRRRAGDGGDGELLGGVFGGGDEEVAILSIRGTASGWAGSSVQDEGIFVIVVGAVSVSNVRYFVKHDAKTT